MSIMQDLLAARGQREAQEQEPGAFDEFGKGLRAGALSSGGQVLATLGQGAEAIGANGVARPIYDWSKSLQGQAQAPELAPRVSDFRDAPKSLRNAWDYGSYLIGASAVPSVAGVVGGLATKNPYVGATLATAPFTIGEQVQRNAADPVASQMPAGERAMNAGLIGLGSAAIGSVVPGMVAGQLGGKAAANTVKGAVLRNALDVPLEGLTEVGQTTLHQGGVGMMNPARDTGKDAEELKQAFFGGLAAGVPFAGVGTAADVTVGRLQRTAQPRAGEQTVGSSGQTEVGVNPDPNAATVLPAGVAAELEPRPETSAAAPVEPAGGAEAGTYMGSAVDDFKTAAKAAYEGFRGAISDVDLYSMVPEQYQPYVSEVTEKLRGSIKTTVKAAKDAYARLQEQGVVPPDVTEAFGDKANQARIFMADAMQKGRAAVDEGADFFRGLLPKSNPDDDLVEAVANGREPLTPEQAAGMGVEQIEAALRENDARFASVATKKVTDLLKDEWVSPETKQRIQQAASNLDDQANRKFVAAQLQAQKLRSRIDEAMSEWKEKIPSLDEMREMLPGSGSEPKRSLVQARDEFPEIVGALQTVLSDRVVPALQSRFPGQIDDPKMINKVGGLLRAAVESSVRGEEMSKKQRTLLRDMLGENQTGPILNEIYQASGLARRDADAAERFYSTLNSLDEMERRDASLNDIVSKNLLPELQGQMRTTDASRLSDTLRKVISGDYERNLAPAQRQFYRNQVKQELVRAFGDKAGSVVQQMGVALGRERAGQKLVQDMWDADTHPEEANYDSPESTIGGDEEAIGGPLGKPEERMGESRYFGTAKEAWRAADLKVKGRDVKFMDSAADAERMYPGSEPAIVRKRRELEEMLAAEHEAEGRFGMEPSKRIEEITGKQFAEETGANVDEKDYGRRLLVVRDLPSNDIAMKPHEFESLKADTRYDKSPTRFRFDEGKNDFLDADRILKYGRQRMKADGADVATTGPVRDAEAFAYGLAAVSEHLGRTVEPAPNTVIFEANGVPVTYSQLQGLMTKAGRATQSTGRADRMNDPQTAQQIEQERWHLEQTLERLELIDGGGAADALRSMNERVKGLEKSPNDLERSAAMTLKGDMQALMKLSKMKGDRRADMIDYLSKRVADLRSLEESRIVAEQVESETDMTGERGRTDIPQDEEIHLASAIKGERDLARVTDAAGLPLKSLSAVSKEEKAAFETRKVGNGDKTRTEIIGITENGRRMLDSRGAKLEQSVSAPERNLGKALRWLATQDLSPQDAALLNAATGAGVPNTERRGTVRGLYKKYRGDVDFSQPSPESMYTETPVAGAMPTQPIDVDATKAAANERRLAMGREERLMRSYDVPQLITDEQLAGLSDNALKTLQKMLVDTSDGRISAPRANELSQAEKARVEGLLTQVRTAQEAADVGRIRLNRREQQVQIEAALDRAFAARQEQARSGGTSPEAKKNALLERIRSGDETLTKQISESTDAKGLQRAIDHLNGLTGAEKDERVLAAIDDMNDRLAMLIQNPDVAYGMLTKKYSLMSAQVHDDLQRDGIYATHDSSHRFDGQFDWRSHGLKGEGTALEGVGTYLHAGMAAAIEYKAEMTRGVIRQLQAAGALPEKVYGKEQNAVEAAVASVLDLVANSAKTELDARQQAWDWESSQPGSFLADPIKAAAKQAEMFAAKSVRSLQRSIDADDAKRADNGRSDAPKSEWRLRDEASLQNAQIALDVARQMQSDQISNDVAAVLNTGQYRGHVSPSYHVSINTNSGALADWRASLAEQPANVRAALEKVFGGKDALADALSAKGLDENSPYSSIYTGLAPLLLKDRQYPAHLARFEGGSTAAEALLSDLLAREGVVGHSFTDSTTARGREPNYVIYDDSRIQTNYVEFSQQAGGGRPPITAQERVELKAYVDKVLGGKIKTHFANMPYAGEFHAAAGTAGAIVLSKTSLDPMGAAHHEALHGFLHQLRATGASDMANALIKAASSGHIQKQLRDLLAGETAALGQLADPEERAAYMFQFYTAGKLTLNDASARGVIKRVTDWIKGVLGLWTAEQNAQRIMDYFESGEYGQNVGNRSALAAVMEGPKKNAALRVLRDTYQTFEELGMSVAAMGSSRLRDTNVPELQQIADLVKRDKASLGQDAGFIPASRMERNERLNQFGALIKGMDAEQIQDAMQALQRGDRTSAATPQGRVLAFGVQKLLREMHDYMKTAGVDIGDLGKNYFPRVWDPTVISKDVNGFKTMLEKYVASGDIKAGSVDVIVARLMTGNGTDLQIETDRPGMVFAKKRDLSFIDGKDAEPWLQKNMLATMEAYISQATRRAEWARRFGDANEKLEGTKDALTGAVIKDGLYQQALKAGATPEQIDVAKEFMQGVNGTLGDHIDPRLRRMMGNMIVYQNVRLLPLAIFSSVVDPAGIVVNGGSVGDAWKTFVRGIKEIPSGFRDNPSRDAAYETAELIGTIDNATLTHTLGALYGQGVMGDTARKINDSFFKYNLMEQFNRSMRVGATEAAMNFLAKHADGKASKHSERWLAELGLKPGEVKLDANGRPLLKAQDFERLGMSKDEAAQQEARIRIAVNQWVDGAILRPDAADRPIWMNDPRYMLISHLKQFVYSFQSTILDRVVHEFDHGNYRPAMALASYVPIMIASDVVKGMIQGGGELPDYKKAWGVGDWVASGVQRAGLFGVTQTGMEGFGGIVGPTVEQFLDAVNVVGGREQFKTFAIDAMPANSLYRFGE